LPASLVHATDVQMAGLVLAHLPGVPACPITQALSVLMNVTEEGWKLAGTGPAGGDSTLAELPGLGVWLGACDGDDVSKFALLGDCETLWLAALCPAAGFTGTEEVVRCIEVSAGTATTTAAATGAADTTVTVSLRIFRRRARRVIISKVPGGGESGCTCSSSQLSSGSR
jgi:hypothetical protein